MVEYLPVLPTGVEYKHIRTTVNELGAKKDPEDVRDIVIVATQRVEVGRIFGSGGRTDNKGKEQIYTNDVTGTDNSVTKLTDEKIPNSCTKSWLKFIRVSPESHEQNVADVKLGKDTVYVAFRPIENGEELIVAGNIALDERPRLQLQEDIRLIGGASQWRCFRCLRCQAVFLDLSRLSSHLYHWCRHQDLNSMPRPSLNEIPTQMRSNVICKVYHCHYCQRLFLSKALLYEHALLNCMRKGSQSGTIATKHARNCWICGAKRGTDLVRHERTHFSWLSFKCETCGATERRRDRFLKHLSTHAGEGNQSNKKDAKRIMRKKKPAVLTATESKEKRSYSGSSCTQFGCKTCGKSFIYQHVLSRHLLTHEDTYRFSCGICFALYKRKDHLTRHLRCHNAQLS